MRILKIALQNINSLQSDKPIVIDFTADNFDEVGVFAITGPTGAGKSSILDAIMIALYHQVPRLGGGGERERGRRRRRRAERRGRGGRGGRGAAARRG